MIWSQPTIKKYIPFLVLLIFSSLLTFAIRHQANDYYQALESAPTTETVKKSQPAIIGTPKPIATALDVIKTDIQLPLKVPFTSQAPLAIWDQLHQEACEEASLLMVYYYRTGQKFTSPQEAEAEIKKMVTWEESNGFKIDLTAQELIAVASRYLKLKTGRVLMSPTVGQLKAELNAGRPVIVPAAGRLLLNHNFKVPGPIYHMLVLKGYDANGFIVNDPGTRRGESYLYSFERIMTAMHDWDPTNILNGRPSVVVFD